MGYTKYDPGDNKKFWEELVAYFPFTVILISDTSRKKTLVCMRNEFKQHSFGGYSVAINVGTDL
jgi:hypothetical protein